MNLEADYKQMTEMIHLNFEGKEKSLTNKFKYAMSQLDHEIQEQDY